MKRASVVGVTAVRWARPWRRWGGAGEPAGPAAADRELLDGRGDGERVGRGHVAGARPNMGQIMGMMNGGGGA